MKLPSLYENNPSREVTEEFTGYNHNERIGAGEFYDMSDMTTLDYPVLSTRKKRYLFQSDYLYKNASCMRIINGDIYFLAVGSAPYTYDSENKPIYGIYLFKNGKEISGNDEEIAYGSGPFDFWRFLNGNNNVVVNGSALYFYPDNVKYDTLTGKFTRLENFCFVDESNIVSSFVYDGLKYVSTSTLTVSAYEIEQAVYFTSGEIDEDNIYDDSNALYEAFSPYLNYYNASFSDIHLFLVFKNLIKNTVKTYKIKLTAENLFTLTESENSVKYDLKSRMYIDKDCNKFQPFIRIDGGGISKVFSQYEAIKAEYNNRIINDRGIVFFDIPDNCTVYECNTDEDYIVINGYTSLFCYKCINEVTLYRHIPKMDYIVSHNNRLYGCRFGKNEKDETLNEIYISALGDIGDFSIISGYETSGFTASVGVNGEFTGAAEYNGYVYFFKDNAVIRVSGSTPSTFSIDTVTIQGVAPGASESIAEHNGYLYYYSRGGVMRFNGSYAVKISDKLGNITYRCVKGAIGDSRYYLSMAPDLSFNIPSEVRELAEKEADEQGLTGVTRNIYIAMRKIVLIAVLTAKNLQDVLMRSNMFIYDIERGFWEKNTMPFFNAVISDISNVYAVDCAGSLYAFSSRENPEQLAGSLDGDYFKEDDFDWFAESGVIGYSMPDCKYVGKMLIRVSLTLKSRMDIYIQYDSSGDWEHLYTIRNVGTKSFTLPVIPRRCDHFKIKLSGHGDAKIYSVTKQTEQGSDIY